MLHKVLATTFRLATVLFLLGGLVIVLAQAIGLALGNGGFVAGVDSVLSAPVYGCAGVAGLLAFALSYAKPRVGATDGRNADSAAPGAGAPAPRSPRFDKPSAS